MPDQPSDTHQRDTSAVLTWPQRLSRWIDDPFASVIVGTIAPTAAVALVFSGIWSLAQLH